MSSSTNWLGAGRRQVAFLPTECACPRIAGRNATGGEKRNEVSKWGARSVRRRSTWNYSSGGGWTFGVAFPTGGRSQHERHSGGRRGVVHRPARGVLDQRRRPRRRRRRLAVAQGEDADQAACPRPRAPPPRR